MLPQRAVLVLTGHSRYMIDVASRPLDVGRVEGMERIAYAKRFQPLLYADIRKLLADSATIAASRLGIIF